MKNALLAIIFSIMALSVAQAQDTRAPSIEITGVNPTDLPTTRVLVNVFDDLGQPVPDLSSDNFSIIGDLADHARIVDVTSFSDQQVPIDIVLVVDVSSSMAGTPIKSAQAAASAFIDAIGSDDSVAVVTFSSGVRLIQDFTTDRQVLMQIINALGYGGQTYLFDGVLAAVDKATETDNPRRAIIVLSDGAQYDTAGRSKATSADVLNRATINGIPIYTIGLGFGVDRHYLQNLSTNTNALFRESPTPAELNAIFGELAGLLRTQYELTLDVDVPLDGTTYDLEIQVETARGLVSTGGRLRSPVPVPVVTLPALASPIDSITEVEATVVADDGLDSVAIMLDAVPAVTLTEGPYTFTIDPLLLLPGVYRLTYTATDVDGDVGEAAVDFEVAALPSDVVFVPALGGEIATVQTFALEISGQTPPVAVQFQLDDSEPVALVEPFSFTIDPSNIASGDHTVTVAVDNAGGATTVVEGLFSVPELPIQFVIEGLTVGQPVAGIVEINIDVAGSQFPITDIAFELNGAAVDSDNGSLTIDPMTLLPGAATLGVIVTNESGQTTAVDINFEVVALPPLVTVSGLEPGETLEADREIVVDIVSQTPVTTIIARLDDQPIVPVDGRVMLDALELGPGPHSLSVLVDTESAQSVLIEMDFAVSEGPSLTATAQFVPTATLIPTSTATLIPSPTATLTVDAQATTQAQQEATQSRAEQLTVTADSEATEQALVMVQTTATAAAGVAETQAQAQATTEAQEQATTDTQAQEQAATAGAEEQVQATVDLQATSDLIATANAESTTTAEAEQATQVAVDEATTEAESTATAEVEMAAQAAADEATKAAEAEQATQTAVDEATTEAESTVTAEVEMAAQAVADEATGAAADEATTEAESTATAEAEMAAQAAAADDEATQAAADEQVTESAQATTDAEATITAGAETQATETVEATEEVTEDGEVTPTEAGTAVAQDVTEETATPVAEEGATAAPTVTPIGTLIPAQAETTPSNETITPILIIVVIVVIVIVLAYLFLSRARRQES